MYITNNVITLRLPLSINVCIPTPVLSFLPALFLVFTLLPPSPFLHSYFLAYPVSFYRWNTLSLHPSTLHPKTHFFPESFYQLSSSLYSIIFLNDYDPEMIWNTNSRAGRESVKLCTLTILYFAINVSPEYIVCLVTWLIVS